MPDTRLPLRRVRSSLGGTLVPVKKKPAGPAVMQGWMKTQRTSTILEGGQHTRKSRQQQYLQKDRAPCTPAANRAHIARAIVTLAITESLTVGLGRSS